MLWYDLPLLLSAIHLLIDSPFHLAFQLQVRLFLDLNDKHSLGFIREELRYEDIYETIDLIVSQFDSCKELLKVKPIFKKHYENFDKILKVYQLICNLPFTNSIFPYVHLDFDSLDLYSQHK